MRRHIRSTILNGSWSLFEIDANFLLQFNSCPSRKAIEMIEIRCLQKILGMSPVLNLVIESRP
jgi:hypothetical protein